MDSLVTIKTFTYAHEAAIAKSFLESENIFCFLKDELTIQAYPFFSNALGGVKLQVKESSIERATALLGEYSFSDVETEQTITIRNDSGTLSECSACGSSELSLVKRPSKSIFGLSYLFLGFPLPFYSSVYHCYDWGRNMKVVRQ